MEADSASEHTTGRGERLSVNGDEGAFKALFERCYLRLVDVAVTYTLDADVAEDMVQETFLSFWNTLQEVKHDGNLEGYLAAGVRNRCRNWLRHKNVTDKYVRNYLAEASEQEEQLYSEQHLARVQALFMRLPEKRREVVRLNIFEKKSYAEIAGLLEISVNTVKDHVKKAYHFMRQEAGDTFLTLLLWRFYQAK